MIVSNSCILLFPGFFLPTPLVHSVLRRHGSIVQHAGLQRILCRRWGWRGFGVDGLILGRVSRVTWLRFEYEVKSDIYKWFILKIGNCSVDPDHRKFERSETNRTHDPTGSRLWLWTTKTWSSPVAQGLTFGKVFFCWKWSEALKFTKSSSHTEMDMDMDMWHGYRVVDHVIFYKF